MVNSVNYQDYPNASLAQIVFSYVSVLSLVLPMYKLPSTKVHRKFSLKALVAQIILGNIVLLMAISIIFTLYSLQIYSPWNYEENKNR